MIGIDKTIKLENLLERILKNDDFCVENLKKILHCAWV